MNNLLIVISLICFGCQGVFCQTIPTGGWEMKSTIDKKYGTNNCLTISVKLDLNVDGTYTRTHRGSSSNSDYKGRYAIDYENKTIKFFESKLQMSDQWIDILNLTYSIISFDDKELIVNECYCGKSEADPPSDDRCVTKYIKN